MMGTSHWRYLIFLLFFTAILPACRVDSDDNPVIIVTTPPEFSVDLYERRDPVDGTPLFGLWVESMVDYDCAGYGIDATVAVENNRIRVTLLGVLPPSPCTGDAAPAKQFLPIGKLPDGVYEFSLSLRDAILNEGTLTIANGRYVLVLPDQSGIDFQNLVLEHLPDGIIWGYAGVPDELSEPVADEFIFDLKTITGEPGLAPGFYSYFTVSGTGNATFHKSIAPAGVSEQFLRRLTTSPDALESLLQGYRGAAQQPLQIRCWTTGGEL